jgi:hypothetical protein
LSTPSLSWLPPQILYRDLLQLCPINIVVKSCFSSLRHRLFYPIHHGRTWTSPSWTWLRPRRSESHYTPPVVGQVIEWPLPKTEYESYPSDDLQTSPSPSNDPEPEPGTSTSSTSPVDQKTWGVKRSSTAHFPEVEYNRVVLSPLPKHLRPGNHYDNSSSSENDDEPTMRFVPATD